MILACVNAGNYFRRGAEYVHNLFRMAKEQSTIPFQFVCLTDDKQEYHSDIIKKDLPVKLSGWWNKISLFNSKMFNKGERIIYFDLDTLIIRNIDDFLSYNGKFAMMGPYRRGSMNQSGIMAWTHGEADHIWQRFCVNGYPNLGGGDQEFIIREMPKTEVLQKLFPDKIYSYKLNKGVFPEKASVVVFNLKPKPHELGGWVKDYYKQGESAITLQKEPPCQRQTAY